MKTITFLGLFAFFAAIAGATHADTLWVDVSDTTKIQTLEEAIDSATGGDVIYVFKGTYMEDTIITIDNKNGLTIVGEDAESSVIVGAAIYPEYLFNIISDSITIKHLALGCILFDYKGNPTLTPTIIKISGSKARVTKCSFYDGLYGAPNHVIYVDSLGGGQIDSCNFFTRDVIVLMDIGSDSLNAENNYWLITDSATIEDIYIEDGKDIQGAGYVKFVPFSQTEF